YFNENDFVAVTGEVRQLSSELAKGKTSAVEKARAFYDYLFENMTYDKTEPGWGEGDIKRVCLVKKGNCTDFHSFFIALCRAGGIASKFVMGVGLPEKDKADISGYHCWAEFYDPRYGWIPVDISEAWKNKNRYEYFFGAVDEKRVEFTQGRGIVLVPSPQNGEALNYFIYPYVEIDGKRSDDVETAFISRRYYAGKKGGGR
ncbi:MAG TPA: transglutaminase-like domain-containing protein, partial [bacterium]|nr:transglutaminase-like domain-containing protein [bacterium]